MKCEDLDDLLGTPARLAILATTATLPSVRDGRRWTFSALGRETGLADGNLHVQTRKLDDAGYLRRQRIRQGNREVTCFELTETGRRALRRFTGLLQDALEGGSGFADLSFDTPPPPRRTDDDSRVW